MENDFAIVTGRLGLRPWRDGDAEALYKYASDPRVSELALWPAHTSVEMSLWVIREVFRPNPDTFAMVLLETGEPVGCIGLVPAGDEHFPLVENEREAGYWIGHPLWGRGLTPEALGGFMDYCSAKLGLSSLLITTDKKNVSSRRVAEKCGFGLVGEYVFEGVPGYAFRRELRPQAESEN